VIGPVIGRLLHLTQTSSLEGWEGLSAIRTIGAGVLIGFGSRVGRAWCVIRRLKQLII
jgi:hypothetical protein